jgi:acyl carrier protein
MTIEQIMPMVKEALIHVLALPQGKEIADDALLFRDLGLDSTRVIELVLTLEDRFSLRIDPDSLDVQHFETPRALAAFVALQAAS